MTTTLRAPAFFPPTALAAATLAGCAGLFGLDPGAPADDAPLPDAAAADGPSRPPADVEAGGNPGDDAGTPDATGDGPITGPGGPCDRRASPPTPSFYCTGFDEEPPIPFDSRVAPDAFSLVFDRPLSARRALRATVAPDADPRQRSFLVEADGTSGRLASSASIRVNQDPALSNARVFVAEHDDRLYELRIRKGDAGDLTLALVFFTSTIATVPLPRGRWVPFSIKLTRTSILVEVDGGVLYDASFAQVPWQGVLARYGLEAAGSAGSVDFDDVRIDAR